MEYFICRAMEIRRLNPDRVFTLQEREKEMKRCLMPYEIQNKFNLSSLKEAYHIPEAASLQEQYILSLKAQFRKLNLYPEKGYINSVDVERIHEFDEKVLATSQIYFDCHLVASKKNLKDELE